MMDGAMSVVCCHSIFRVSVFRVSVFSDLGISDLFNASSRLRSFIAPCADEISFFREYIVPASDAAFFVDQNFALSGVIGLADNALKFHPLHQ